MKPAQKTTTNGRTLKNVYTLLKRTGKGAYLAANTGYRAGYFMAKHPELENARTHLQKNYKVGLFAIAGIILGIMAFLMMKK
ncbi:MAG: hypothetical protein A2Y25_11095 [Candidatus Melainabacteria bacterium GWF2_37_15]|nr:MAG: hypothetical protein A2Y25_11095 [Candidatus Melainabacteria bacterium GWF2_37_15]